MVHLAFNETLTNGCLDLDFSDNEEDDISMTCDFVTDFNQPSNLNHSVELKSFVSCNQKKNIYYEQNDRKQKNEIP